MPEGYTHARTARKAAEYAEYTPQNMTAFIAGANGPDNLFGYQVWRSARNRTPDLPSLGNRMHREKTGAFLCALIKNAETPAQRDYVMGFLNHYATDSTAHPYVYAVMQQGQIYHRKGGHGYFEIGLDSWLHKKDYGSALVPVKHSNPRLVGAAKAEIVTLLAKSIREVYETEISPTVLSDAFDIFYYIRLLCPSPLGIKKTVFWFIEPLMGGRGFMTGHCTPARLRGVSAGDKKKLPRPWQNPFTGEVRDESITDLLDRAAKLGAACMIVTRQFWQGKISEKRMAAALGSRSYNDGRDTLHSDPDGLGGGSAEDETRDFMNKL